MEQEDQELQAAQERLKVKRREAGVSETVHRSPTTSTRETLDEMLSRCWKHKDQVKPCPLCETKRTEWMANVKERQEREMREDEEKRKSAVQHVFDHPENAMEDAGIGKRYLSCSFDTFQGGDRYVSIARKCAESPHDLVLWGCTGSGKTHLAVSIVREIVRRGKKAVFITTPELLLQIRDTFAKDNQDSENEIIERYARVPLLILDDLGAEKSTEWSITTLYLIIDRRYREERPTIITTNLSPAEIQTALGARIASRLTGMTIGELKLPDYRKRRVS